MPPLLSQEWHEAACEHGLVEELGAMADDAHDSLELPVADGCDQSAPVGAELVEERFRYGGRSGGDEKRVEGRLAGPPRGTVTGEDGDVLDAQLLHDLLRSLRQRSDPLDAEYL